MERLNSLLFPQITDSDLLATQRNKTIIVVNSPAGRARYEVDKESISEIITLSSQKATSLNGKSEITPDGKLKVVGAVIVKGEILPLLALKDDPSPITDGRMGVVCSINDEKVCISAEEVISN